MALYKNYISLLFISKCSICSCFKFCVSISSSQAKIFIQFSLKYRSSQPEAVESCAEEFKVHILSILPAKFQLVSQHVVPTFCQLMSYQAGSTNVTRTSWDCPEGYQLDPTIFVCQR